MSVVLGLRPPDLNQRKGGSYRFDIRKKGVLTVIYLPATGPWTLVSSPVQGDTIQILTMQGSRLISSVRPGSGSALSIASPAPPSFPPPPTHRASDFTKEKEKQQGLGSGEGGDASEWPAQTGSCMVPTEDMNSLMECPWESAGPGTSLPPSSCAGMGGDDHGLWSPGQGISSMACLKPSSYYHSYINTTTTTTITMSGIHWALICAWPRTRPLHGLFHITLTTTVEGG